MGLFDLFGKKKVQSKQSFRERRLVPRWKMDVPAKISWPSRNAYLECKLLDINFKGFAISSPEALPEGCSAVTFLITDRHLFNIEISVAWHLEKEGRHFYGIKFMRLREIEKEKLYRMMKEDFPQVWKP